MEAHPLPHSGGGGKKTESPELSCQERIPSFFCLFPNGHYIAWQIALRPPEAVDNTPYMSAKAREIGENLLLVCLAPERSQTNKLVREDFIRSHAIQSVTG